MKKEIINSIFTVILIVMFVLAAGKVATITNEFNRYKSRTQELLKEYDSLLVDWAGEDVADSVKHGVNYELWNEYNN